MKIFFSEGKPDYDTYTFNYGIYCAKENQSELPSIYNQGFLPYSGDINLNTEVFYLARSLRVDLDRFVDSSENRRVNRKISDLDIQMSYAEKASVLAKDSDFIAFAKTYTSQRIGTEKMTLDRLNYILTLSTGSHIFTFASNGSIVGYVLACIEGSCLHYWFSFFDIALMQSHSLGKWMMWRVITWAKENDLQHVYLGTCYGEKSLYKVRDHKGLAFFDGHGWNHDMKLLKTWCKSDGTRTMSDRLKESEDKNEYLKKV